MTWRQPIVYGNCPDCGSPSGSHTEWSPTHPEPCSYLSPAAPQTGEKFVYEGDLEVTFWGDTAFDLGGYDLDEVLKAMDDHRVRVTIEVLAIPSDQKETP